MKLLGKRSLSSVLKVFLDFGFYSAILGGILIVAVLALTGVSESGNFSYNLPVVYDLDPAAYKLDSSAGQEVQAVIEQSNGTLTITGGSRVRFLLPILVVLPVFVVIVLVLQRLRRIFRRLIEGRPFLAENAGNLRLIGVVVIVGELAWAGFVYWSTHLVMNEFTSSGVTLHAMYPARAPVILAGLVLLIVAEIFREGAQMKTDLETAREIQFSLVPGTEYQNGPVSIHSKMRPANTVGGDYYDVIDLGEGRIAFVVADVAGKGLPAALLMALLQGSLRSLISSGFRGAELVGKLNTYLVANTPANRMVTFFYGELDPASGQLHYVNAGHNPPYLYDSQGMIKLDSTGAVLGLFDGLPFSQESVELGDGARLLLYTDGITEAATPADEEYGERRLERLIGEQGQLAPASLIENVVANVIKFCGKAKPPDDMTMMVVSRAATAVR